MAKPFRMPKAKRSIPLSRLKELRLQAKHGRIKQLNEFILKKIDEIDLEHFIPRKAVLLAIRYPAEEYSAHLAMAIHAKIVDALGLPESKARIIKKIWALEFLADKGTDMPIKAESLARVVNQALYAANTLLHEQARKPRKLGRMLSWKYYCLSRLKELNELPPSAEVRVSGFEFGILSSMLGAFNARYLNKDQLALIEIERDIQKAILKKMSSGRL